VKLSLVKSFLPLLTYCMGGMDVMAHQLKDIAVCWNDCFRRIFGYKRYESVKTVQFYCGEQRVTLELMYDLSRWKFLNGLLCGPASLRFTVFYELNRHVVYSYSLKYGCERSSKFAVVSYFASSVQSRLQ